MQIKLFILICCLVAFIYNIYNEEYFKRKRIWKRIREKDNIENHYRAIRSENIIPSKKNDLKILEMTEREFERCIFRLWFDTHPNYALRRWKKYLKDLHEKGYQREALSPIEDNVIYFNENDLFQHKTEVGEEVN